MALGFKQGCGMSPWLFNVNCTDGVMKERQDSGGLRNAIDDTGEGPESTRVSICR